MTVGVRPGRPRHGGPLVEAEAPSTRAQLLEAAAALFTAHGFAGTTTRMIAERVGIRQASLYYHFAGKDELLMDLLAASVRPSLDAVRTLESQVGHRAEAAVALHRLACIDVATLARTQHNVGTLYLLPEVQHPRFAAFHADRAELARAYGRLGVRAASDDVLADLDADRLGALLIQLVEVVIGIRRDRVPDARDAADIAASCLRLCGLSRAEVLAAQQ